MAGRWRNMQQQQLTHCARRTQRARDKVCGEGNVSVKSQVVTGTMMTAATTKVIDSQEWAVDKQRGRGQGKPW